MKTNNKIFVSCEEAQSICDKSQYGEASFLEKMKLKIRLCYCKLTRDHSERNTKLTQVIQNAKLLSLDNKYKEVLKQKLKNEVSKNGL